MQVTSHILAQPALALAIAGMLLLGSPRSDADESGLIERHYRTIKSDKKDRVRLRVQIPLGDQLLTIFVVDGEIEDFLKEGRSVEGIIASTNIQLDPSAEFPLVQAAIRNARPKLAVEIDKRLEKERKTRLRELASATDPTENLRVFGDVAESYVALTPPVQDTPSHLCFIATDDARGGTAELPDFITFNRPERVADQVANCLSSMVGKVKSVAVPLIGAASNGLKDQAERSCRMRNAFIGVAEGIQNCVVSRCLAQGAELREIAIVVYKKDLDGLGNLAVGLSPILEAVLKTVSENVRKSERARLQYRVCR